MGWRSKLSAAVPPYQLLLVIVGAVIGLRVHGFQLQPSLLLALFIPPLVFEAALTLDLVELRGVALVVALQASLGVLLTVLLVALLTHLAIGLAWGSALLLGAVVAATDPIATIAVVRRVAAPPRLAAVLEGESLFNDGTGVAAFAAVLGTQLGGPASPGDALARFGVLVLGGTLVGAALGLLARAILRHLNGAAAAGAVTVGCAFGAYLVADGSGGSGVVAVVVAGILVATGDHRSEPFWRELARLQSGVLFLLLGIALPLTRVLAMAVPVLAAYAGMVLARAPVYLIAVKLPWRWRHVLFWGGLRGALAVALALSLPGRPGVDPRVPWLAYGMVVLSLLVQGGTLGVLAGLILSEGRPRQSHGGPPATRPG